MYRHRKMPISTISTKETEYKPATARTGSLFKLRLPAIVSKRCTLILLLINSPFPFLHYKATPVVILIPSPEIICFYLQRYCIRIILLARHNYVLLMKNLPSTTFKEYFPLYSCQRIICNKEAEKIVNPPEINIMIEGKIDITMNKENKINMFLASLAQIIGDYDNLQNFTNPPSVIFLSASEVQTIEQEGNTPTNKVYTDDPLRNLLKSVVDNYYKDEEKHWLESLCNDYPQVDISDTNEIYNSGYLPEHMYHKLRILKKLISE